MKLRTLYLALLFSVTIGCVNCSTSKSSDYEDDEDSSDSSSVLDTKSDEADNEPQGMLKAFGLKGKVKTLTLCIGDDETEGFVFAFDPQGNYYKYNNYNGEAVNFEVEDTGAYCSIGIDDWKINGIIFYPRWNGGTTYEITSYDDHNRPSSASIYFELIENELAKKDVPISYSGFDSKGNYTKIHIDTRGIKEPGDVWGLFDVINLKIVYWPEDATNTNIVKPKSHNPTPYSVTLTGAVGGKYAVEMILDGQKDSNGFYPLSGKYRYTKNNGAWITLEIESATTIDDITSLELYEFYDGKLTGTWDVRYNMSENTLVGTMTNNKNDTYEVSLHGSYR